MSNKKISFVQVCLTVLFVTALLISNVITAKQVLLPFGITMTGAVFVFPITYILSDVFSEVYGYTWSRITCYFAFAMNLFMVIVFGLVILTPAPDYWTNQEAFATVLGSTPRVMGASLLAYVVGDFVNDKVFKKMKEKHANELKGFGFRAIVSSLLGELCDSLVFLPLAFIGQMPLKTLAIMTVCQVGIKTCYEIVILPITTLVAKKVGKYENTYRNVEKEKASLQDVQFEIDRQYRRDFSSKDLKESRIMCVVGLTEEAGEVAGLLKRQLRHNSRDEGRATQSEFMEELGDVLWYLTACCMLYGFDLDDVWSANKRKLSKRYKED